MELSQGLRGVDLCPELAAELLRDCDCPGVVGVVVQRHWLTGGSDGGAIEAFHRLEELGESESAWSSLCARGVWWVKRGRLGRAAYLFSYDGQGRGLGRCDCCCYYYIII